jgi:hypothetical protein
MSGLYILRAVFKMLTKVFFSFKEAESEITGAEILFFRGTLA